MELYLIAFIHETDAVLHTMEMRSISFTGEQFKHLRTVRDIANAIEKQTDCHCVQVMAVTALHKLIDYAGEHQANSKLAVTSPY